MIQLDGMVYFSAYAISLQALFGTRGVERGVDKRDQSNGWGGQESKYP
jgi:hypothetical protein